MSDETRDFEIEIKIPNPPAHYDLFKKKTNDHVRYYLTGNLFYSEKIHFSTRIKIVNYVKEFLLPYFSEVPLITDMYMRLDFFNTKTQRDLDNLESFWKKVILDMMKTPTEKQLIRAAKYKSKIITINALADDSVLHANEYYSKYHIRGNMLVVTIKARKVNRQPTIFD